MAEAKKKHWLKGALSNAHGQFARKAEKAGETTREFAEEHAEDGGKTGKQARLAETLMKFHKRVNSKHMIRKMYGKKLAGD